MTDLLIMEVMPREDDGSSLAVLEAASAYQLFSPSLLLSGGPSVCEEIITILESFMALNYAIIMSIFQECSFPYANNFNPFNQFFSQHIIF